MSHRHAINTTSNSSSAPFDDANNEDTKDHSTNSSSQQQQQQQSIALSPLRLCFIISVVLNGLLLGCILLYRILPIVPADQQHSLYNSYITTTGGGPGDSGKGTAPSKPHLDVTKLSPESTDLEKANSRVSAAPSSLRTALAKAALAEYIQDELHVSTTLVKHQHKHSRYRCKKKKSVDEACQLRIVGVPAKDINDIVQQQEKISESGGGTDGGGGSVEVKSPRILREKKLEAVRKRQTSNNGSSVRTVSSGSGGNSESPRVVAIFKNVGKSLELHGSSSSITDTAAAAVQQLDWLKGEHIDHVAAHLVGPLHGDKTSNSVNQNSHSYEVIYDKYLTFLKYGVLAQREESYRRLVSKYSNSSSSSSNSRAELLAQCSKETSVNLADRVFFFNDNSNPPPPSSSSSSSPPPAASSSPSLSPIEKQCLRHRAGLPLRILDLGATNNGGGASFRLYDSYFYAEEKRNIVAYQEYVEGQMEAAMTAAAARTSKSPSGSSSSTDNGDVAAATDDDSSVIGDDAEEADDLLYFSFTGDYLYVPSSLAAKGFPFGSSLPIRNSVTSTGTIGHPISIPPEYQSIQDRLLRKKFDYYTTDAGDVAALTIIEREYLSNRSSTSNSANGPNGKMINLGMGEYADVSRVKGMCKQFGREGNHSHMGSSSQEASSNGNDRWYEFDLIIDETLHSTPIQINAFHTIFLHCLSPGGVYIVEELQTSFYPPLGASEERQRKRQTIHSHLMGLLELMMKATNPQSSTSTTTTTCGGGVSGGNVGSSSPFVEMFPQVLETLKWVDNIDCDREVCAVRKRLAPV